MFRGPEVREQRRPRVPAKVHPRPTRNTLQQNNRREVSTRVPNKCQSLLRNKRKKDKRRRQAKRMSKSVLKTHRLPITRYRQGNNNFQQAYTKCPCRKYRPRVHRLTQRCRLPRKTKALQPMSNGRNRHRKELHMCNKKVCKYGLRTPIQRQGHNNRLKCNTRRPSSRATPPVRRRRHVTLQQQYYKYTYNTTECQRTTKKKSRHRNTLPTK